MSLGTVRFTNIRLVGDVYSKAPTILSRKVSPLSRVRICHTCYYFRNTYDSVYFEDMMVCITET